FTAWTPRLLRAVYNYHTARQDYGAYAHNGRYIVKLLHDSISDLNGQLSDPVDLSKADRNAPGHFNAASEAARHWDEDESVSASCSKCHSGATGYRFWVEHGATLEVSETDNGMECFTCHDSFGSEYATLTVPSTSYPGGISLEHPGNDNMCATCHSGRESKATIDAAIAGNNLRFLNVHYLPAAAVRNGNLSAVGYQYDGKVYAGHLQHESRTQCTGCHEPGNSNHTFMIEDVWENTCRTCHNDQTGPEQIRTEHLLDYDGDGNTGETLVAELDGLERANSALGPNFKDKISASLYIVGYTDTVGNAGDNQKLSENRAKAIAQYFVDKGAWCEIYYAGMGERGLAVETGDSVDEVRNRRALYILGVQKPAGGGQVPPQGAWKKLADARPRMLQKLPELPESYVKYKEEQREKREEKFGGGDDDGDGGEDRDADPLEGRVAAARGEV
ncbi:MAG: OmpA family protein, partial [Myxococcales bacterium]|nr:OmpA family protein [Myxococcales bacterium]